MRFGWVAIACACLVLSCAVVAGIDRFEPKAVDADGGQDAPPPITTGDGGLPTCNAPCDDRVCPGGACLARLAGGIDGPQSLAIVGEYLVVASGAALDGGGSLMLVPRVGGSVRIIASDLERPAVRQAAADAGAVLAYERLADTASLPLTTFNDDAGLVTLATDGKGIGSAAASPTWFAKAAPGSGVRAESRSGGYTWTESDSVRVLGLRGNVLVTEGKNGEVTVRTLSVDEDTVNNPGVLFGNGTKVGDVTVGSVIDALLDRDRIYVATSDASIRTVEYDAGLGAPIPPLDTTAVALTADERVLFVAARAGIVAIDKASGVATLRYEVVAAGVAVDDKFLYWTEPASRSVMRAPK